MINEIDPENIRVLLRRYDQYYHEVTARARQLSPDASSSEPVRPVNLSFCVDPEYLYSAIALGFIERAETNEDPTDSLLRTHLESLSTESTDTVTLEALTDIVEKEMAMDISVGSSKVRIRSLVVVPQVITPSWTVLGHPRRTEGRCPTRARRDQACIAADSYQVRSIIFGAEAAKGLQRFHGACDRIVRSVRATRYGAEEEKNPESIGKEQENPPNIKDRDEMVRRTVKTRKISRTRPKRIHHHARSVFVKRKVIDIGYPNVICRTTNKKGNRG